MIVLYQKGWNRGTVTHGHTWFYDIETDIIENQDYGGRECH